MKLNLTKKQEQMLIKKGLESYLNDIFNPPVRKVVKKKKSKGWSKARREAFAKSMAKTWAKKRKNGIK